MNKLFFTFLLLASLLHADTSYPKLFAQLGTPLYKADRSFINISKLDADIKKKAKYYHLKVKKLLILAEKIESDTKSDKADKKKYINGLRGLQKDYDEITRDVNIYLIKSIDVNNYQEFTRVMNLGHDLFLQNNIIKKRAMAYYVEHRTRGKIPVLEYSYLSLKTDPILYAYVKGHMPRIHLFKQRYSNGGIAHQVLLSPNERAAFVGYGDRCFESVDIAEFEDASALANFDFHAQSCQIIDIKMSSSGKYIFLSDLENGFTVLDITQAKAPLQRDEWTNIKALSSVTDEDEVTSFVLRKDRGLVILDIYNKDAFRLLAQYNKGLKINHLALDDTASKLYLAHSEGLSVLDVSVLGNPREIYHFPIKDGANNIILSPNKKIAYVASGDNGVHVLDLSKENEISLTSTCLTPSYAYELMLSKNGEKLFVSALNEGVYYIDTRNPYDLKHVSTYKLDKKKASALGSNLNAKEDTLYIAYGKHGLAKVHLKD